MNILHIDSSILGQRSVSRELSALIVERLTVGTAHDVIYRDVVADDLPHFTPITAPAAHPLSNAAPALNETQAKQRAVSDAILTEFMTADTLVIGVPMYNFGIPSELKAWLDRVIVPGTTFRYDANGVEGLAGGKRIILAIARGGSYGPDAGMASFEHAESFLRVAFGFLGITNIEVVVAEGLNAEATKETALASAREASNRVAA
ncbi:FMN-dependent NADH-azoreductase [Sphingomonas koreensis]|nr:FMN-dependent NADH-azoreductase [Sphingomonas koreensis]